jgi:hypothetical protein
MHSEPLITAHVVQVYLANARQPEASPSTCVLKVVNLGPKCKIREDYKPILRSEGKFLRHFEEPGFVRCYESWGGMKESGYVFTDFIASFNLSCAFLCLLVSLLNMCPIILCLFLASLCEVVPSVRFASADSPHTKHFHLIFSTKHTV